MATRSKTSLQGEAELIRKLKLMPEQLRPVLEAVPPAAEIVRASAARIAPVGNPGEGNPDFAPLKQSIIIQEVKRTAGFINVRIGPSEDAPHGMWVELGHAIRRTPKGEIVGTIPPQPFLGWAWKQNRNAARAAIRKAFRDVISRFRE